MSNAFTNLVPKKKPQPTVSSILSGFATQVQQLKDLQSQKESEVVSTNAEIASLNQRAVDARTEAEKAQRAAQKIQSFLED